MHPDIKFDAIPATNSGVTGEKEFPAKFVSAILNFSISGEIHFWYHSGHDFAYVCKISDYFVNCRRIYAQKQCSRHFGRHLGFWRPIVKIAQGCQTGTRRILNKDLRKYRFQQKNLGYTPKPGSVKFLLDYLGDRPNQLVSAIGQ